MFVKKRVISTELLNFEGLVYNLEVEKDESYVVDGFVVHNCISLDGSEIPVGDVLQDHPNGNCTLTFKVKSLEEMGFSYSDLPPAARRRWTGIQVPYRNMRSRFYALPEAEQRKVFGNDKLFNFWKKEKFPLEQLAVNRGGMFVPATYKQIVAKLETLGGVSSPNVGIAYKTGLKAPDAALTPKDKQFMNLIDPKDRANSRSVVIRDIDADQLGDLKTANGQNLMGFGDDAVSGVPPQLLGDAIAKLNGKAPMDADWYDFNEYARKLGLATRKASDGSTYWIVGKGKVDDVVKGLASKNILPKTQKWNIKKEDWRTDDYKKWSKKNFGDWNKGISQEEHNAISNYSVSGHATINRGLRREELFKYPKRLQDQVKAIDAIVARAKIPEDLMVFRGLEWPELAKGGKSLIGTIIEDKGFVSTSLGKDFAEKFLRSENSVLMRIKLPKGSNVAPISYANPVMINVREMLIGRNARFRVIDVAFPEYGSYKYDITVELIK